MDASKGAKGLKNSDEHWMAIALELAKGGQGWVEPNPMVGCVVVRDGELIASGFHERFGGPHAEVHALRGLDAEVLSQSTVYVTLEPCAHHGKTPPCVELLLSKPPSRVVVAMQDPFEKVAGLGISRLEHEGIDVTTGVLGEQARRLNAPYLKRLASGLPWVITKWAMTLDGAIATGSLDSKWISNELSRQQVHRLRSRVDAVVVGSSTVLADDPLLTARLGPGEHIARTAMRVVLDRRFRTMESSQLVCTAREAPVIVVVDREALAQFPDKRRAIEGAGAEFLAWNMCFERSSGVVERMFWSRGEPWSWGVCSMRGWLTKSNVTSHRRLSGAWRHGGRSGVSGSNRSLWGRDFRKHIGKRWERIYISLGFWQGVRRTEMGVRTSSMSVFLLHLQRRIA